MVTGIYGRVKNPKIKLLCIMFINSTKIIKSGFSYRYISSEKIWKHNTNYFLVKFEKDLNEYGKI